MSNLKWKRRISLFWPSKQQNTKLILLYHSIGNSLWAMPEKRFREQINWLSDFCKIMSLPEVISNKKTDDIQISITFDDGYQSLHTLAAPILANKKINATVYLNTGWISECEATRKKSEPNLGHYPDEKFLIWQEVKDLKTAGWTIGSHGVNHHNFAIVNEEITQHELLESKKNIESQLDSDCIHFAYPFGRYSNAVKKIAKQTGYHYAAAARHGYFTEQADQFAFPRINIEKNYSLKDFQQIILGKWNFLSWIHKARGL